MCNKVGFFVLHDVAHDVVESQRIMESTVTPSSEIRLDLIPGRIVVKKVL